MWRQILQGFFRQIHDPIMAKERNTYYIITAGL